MRLKKILLSLFITLLLVVTIFPALTQAEDDPKNNQHGTFKAFGDNSGLSPASGEPKEPLAIITAIIKVGLSFLGVVFLVLIIISGFKWMTTSSPDEIKKIRAKIINATIGLVIVLAAYGLTTFISEAIFTSLQAPTP